MVLVLSIYIEPEPAYWSKLFTSFDSAACVTFLIVYILKMYVATHRMQYIFSVLSLLDLFTLLPTIILFQVSYDNSFYFMIPFSRYARSVTSFLIIQRYFKLGQSDVDRQINIVFITMLLLTYIASGMYAIVENQKRKLSDKTFLQFLSTNKKPEKPNPNSFGSLQASGHRIVHGSGSPNS
jgi:hypothetical protein